MVTHGLFALKSIKKSGVQKEQEKKCFLFAVAQVESMFFSNVVWASLVFFIHLQGLRSKQED